MTALLNAALDWVYPRVCMACRRVLPAGESRPARLSLCERCEPLLTRVQPPCCPRCGKPGFLSLCGDCRGRVFHFTANASAFVYEDVLRDILHEVKFRGRRAFAEGLGRLWAETVGAADADGWDAAVPVPLHAAKLKERGFNQAEVLARPLAARLGLPLAIGWLSRARETPPQSGFSPQARARNVAGAFTAGPRDEIKNKKILIIDDIYTTGASVNACAEALRRQGAAAVRCMTLCVTLKKKRISDDM